MSVYNLIYCSVRVYLLEKQLVLHIRVFARPEIWDVYVQKDQKTKKYWDSPELRCSVPHNPSRRESLHTLFKLITGKKEMCREVSVPLIRGPKSNFIYAEKKPFKPTNLTHSPHVCWFPTKATLIVFSISVILKKGQRLNYDMGSKKLRVGRCLGCQVRYGKSLRFESRCLRLKNTTRVRIPVW
jgi:hypothetical protein